MISLIELYKTKPYEMSLEEALEYIEKCILNAYHKGDNSVDYLISKTLTQEVLNRVVKVLKENGYKIKETLVKSDDYTKEWKYLHIEWKREITVLELQKELEKLIRLGYSDLPVMYRCNTCDWYYEINKISIDDTNFRCVCLES